MFKRLSSPRSSSSSADLSMNAVERAAADLENLVAAVSSAKQCATKALNSAKAAQASQSLVDTSNLYMCLATNIHMDTDVWGFPDSNLVMLNGRGERTSEQTLKIWKEELEYMLRIAMDRGRSLDDVLEDIKRSGVSVPAEALESLKQFHAQGMQAMEEEEELEEIEEEEEEGDEDDDEIMRDDMNSLKDLEAFEALVPVRYVGRQSAIRNRTVAGHRVFRDIDSENGEEVNAELKAEIAHECGMLPFSREDSDEAFKERKSKEKPSEEELRHTVANGCRGLFVDGIYACLKQIHPSTSITAEAAAIVNDLVVDVVVQVASQALNLSRTPVFQSSQEEPGLVLRECVVCATRTHLRGELAKHAVVEEKKASESSKPNLVWNIDTIKVLVQERVSGEMGEDINVCLKLAALAEYMTAEVVELSGNAARDHNSEFITPYDIVLAVENDEELFHVLCRNGSPWPRPMCLPSMHVAILRDRRDQQEDVRVRDDRALAEIRDEQTSRDFAIPRDQFEKLAVEISQQFKLGVGFSDGALEALQAATESFVLERFNRAGLLAHTQKERLGFPGLTVQDLRNSRAGHRHF